MTARELLKSAALGTASLLVLLAIVEAGVRLFLPEGRWRFHDATADWQLDPELGWVHRPDLDVESRVFDRPVRFRTNRDGLIPAAAAREGAPETLRVMVFGDSMVVGRALPQDEIYTARLEHLLRERGVRAEVLNAGVQGYATDQVLLLMRRWLPVYRPDVAIYGSTLNDFGGIALDWSNNQAKPRFELVGRGELRLHRPRIGAEVQPYGRSGPRRWIQHSAFYRALQPRIFQLRARLSGRNEQVALGLYPEAFVDPRFGDSLDWLLYGALVERMRDTASSVGARFLLFAHPDVGEVWDPNIERICSRLGVSRSRYDPFAMERRTAQLAEERGVDFMPVVDAFRSAQERGPFHLLPHDAHLGPAGHELLAELLSEQLRTRLASGAAPASARAPDAQTAH